MLTFFTNIPIDNFNRYSADAQCPFVFVTDYVETLLIKVEETGVTRCPGPNNTIICEEDTTKEPTMLLDDDTKYSFRFKLFAIACSRLIQFGVL